MGLFKSQCSVVFYELVVTSQGNVYVQNVPVILYSTLMYHNLSLINCDLHFPSYECLLVQWSIISLIGAMNI